MSGVQFLVSRNLVHGAIDCLTVFPNEFCRRHHIIRLVYDGKSFLPQGQIAVPKTAITGKVDPPRLVDWFLTVQARRLEPKRPPHPDIACLGLISQIEQREILAHNAPACDLTDPPRALTYWLMF